jgi:Adaptor complexes medium subunit family
LTTLVTGATGMLIFHNFSILKLSIAWRPEGIIYSKNQVWIDIIESVNVLLSNKGKTNTSQF